MANLQWMSVNLMTGRIVADLPDVDIGQEQLGATIGQYESAQVSLNVETTTSADWLQGTQPGGTALIAWNGNESAPRIIWGGIVRQRLRALGNTVPLALDTPEAYLEGCYVGDYTATDLNQDTILESLMAYTGGPNRIPIVLNHLTPSTAVQSVAYTASSQTTVYAALQALSGVANGPEWTMDWVWDVPAGTIFPRLNYGARVGSPVLAGNLPNVTVEQADLRDGSLFMEDYSPGHGANDVIGWGVADPLTTTAPLASAQATAADLKGRPLWSYAYQPNQTVTDSPTLATYVTAALAQLEDGAQPLTLVMSNDTPGKVFGVDWFLGDDLGWHLTGPAFPSAVSGTARCIGYKADTTTITPILQGASLG